MPRKNRINGYYCFHCDSFTEAKRESRKLETCPKCGHRASFLRGINLDQRTSCAGDPETVVDEDQVNEEYTWFTGNDLYTPEDLEEFIEDIFTGISSNCWELDMHAVRTAHEAANK